MRVDYAARARALVGTRFRAQGRGEGGLDCVGVVLATYEIAPSTIRQDYALRGDHLKEVQGRLDTHFRRIAAAQLRGGDLMLTESGSRQLHLAVRTEDGFVHAHAGIRRVVESPGMPEWPILGLYRKRGR